MLSLYKKYIDEKNLEAAMMVGTNIVSRRLFDNQFIKEYICLILSIAEESYPQSTDSLIKTASEVLSIYSENVELNDAIISDIVVLRSKIAQVKKRLYQTIQEAKAKQIKSKLIQNDALMDDINSVLHTISSTNDKSAFDDLVARIEVFDKQIDKDSLSGRQKERYKNLSEKCLSVVETKQKEITYQENLKYNIAAVEAYKKVFAIFKNEGATDNPPPLEEFFSFDKTRLFRETQIYYDYVYTYILNHLSDDEKFKFTKCAILNEKG